MFSRIRAWVSFEKIKAVIALARRFRMRRSVVVILFIIGGFIGWHFVRPMVVGDARITGKAEAIQPRVVVNELIYTCDIQSNREKSYRQSSSGTVVKQGAKLGDYVEAGKFLVQVDSTSLKEEQSVTRENLGKLQRDLAAKKKLLTSARTLYERDLGSQQAVVDAKTAYAGIMDEINRTKRKLAESSGAVKSLTITAQFSGYITDQMAFVGDMVSNDQVIFVESDLDDLYARFFVSNKYKGLLRAGLPVQYYDPYKKTQICSGQVNYIGKFASQKGILIEANFKPSSPSEALDYYKQQVEIRIKVGQSSSEVPSVPLSAVYFNDQGPYIFVIHRGITQETPVKLGFIGSEFVEIREPVGITDPVLISSDSVPRAGMSFKTGDNAHAN